MKIDIENLAKIEHASVKVDGITVIAGENNTGKSTVGKILFALFNSTVQLEEKVYSYRRNRIYNFLRRGIDEIQMLSEGSGNIWERNMIPSNRQLDRSVDEVMEADGTKEVYLAVIDFYEKLELFKPTDAIIDKLQDITIRINQTLEIEDQKVYHVLMEDYFTKVFNGQVNNIYEPEKKAVVDLCLHNSQHLEVEFENQKCRIARMEFRTNHEAVYIDSPFLLDKINDYWYFDGNEQENLLLKKLTQDTNAEENLFEKIIANEKLNEIFQKFDSVFKGRILKDEDDEYKVQYRNKPLRVSNLSTGLKSFSIIRLLLEKGMLKEKDVLILDEPEIHLHPQWQLIYAEIIVLLQKYFDLSIVITTHSHYFLDAIEVYSAKHGISDKVNYYLADCKDEKATLVDVTRNLDLIYQKLAAPLDTLDSIRY